MKAKFTATAVRNAVTAALAVGLAVASPAQAASSKQHQSDKINSADDRPLGVWGGYPFDLHGRY